MKAALLNHVADELDFVFLYRNECMMYLSDIDTMRKRRHTKRTALSASR